MPRVKEHLLCRAHVPGWGQCLAPAERDGQPNCSHGRSARKWAVKFAPKGKR